MNSQLADDAALIRKIADRIDERPGMEMRYFARVLRIDAEHLEEIAHWEDKLRGKLGAPLGPSARCA